MCRLALYGVSPRLLRPSGSWLQVANDTIIILLGLVFCVMQPLIAPLAGKCSLHSTYLFRLQLLGRLLRQPCSRYSPVPA